LNLTGSARRSAQRTIGSIGAVAHLDLDLQAIGIGAGAKLWRTSSTGRGCRSCRV
jgi:hypothetical protein